jgi:DNA polymerase
MSAGQEWANRLGLQLDYDPFARIYQRDVNNYLAVPPEGKPKTKGVFFPGEYKNGRWVKPLEKGFDAPIVSIALYKYLVDDVPIETTIRDHKDVYDFMIAKKVGSQFKSVIYDGVSSEVQQKTNRFIITTEGVSLVKLHLEKHKIDNIVKGELLQVLNNVTDDNAHNYPIRYGYYIDRTQKIIDLINPPQKPLF